jgi:hypothetical protein
MPTFVILCVHTLWLHGGVLRPHGSWRGLGLWGVGVEGGLEMDPDGWIGSGSLVLLDHVRTR